MASSGVADGTPIQIYTDNGSGAQKWKLVLKATPLQLPNAGFETPTEGRIFIDGAGFEKVETA